MPFADQLNIHEAQLKHEGPQTLFESPALKLVYEKGNDATVWISFGAAEYGLAFGRSYISKRGNSAFYFIPNAAHWYQTPDIWEALRIARAKLNRSARIIAYGSSMGAFAAIAFAKEIDPHLIIAASPQCSICPTVVGAFDRRWADVAQRSTFVRKDAREKLPRKANVVFIYDPLHHEDRLNVKLLADALDQPKFIAAPLGGHGVLHALRELGLLKGLIDTLANGDVVDPDWFSRIFRKKRKSSSHYFFALGQYYDKRHNRRRAVELYLRANARGETDTVYRFLIDPLCSLGFKEEAVLAAKKACDLNPYEIAHVIRYAFALMDLGRLDEALEFLGKADEQRPGTPEVLNALSIGLRQQVDVLWSQGFREEAILAAKRACELNPHEVSHIIRYSFALMDLGRLDEALEILGKADEQRPDTPEVLNAISIGLRLKGEFPAAVPFLRRAVQLLPANMAWQNDLKWLESAAQ